MSESENTVETGTYIGRSPPKRLNGAGKIFLRGRRWTIRYYHRGRQFQETARPNTEAQARRLLRKRLGEIGIGLFIGPDETRLTFENLVTGLENDYKLNGRRSFSTMQFHVRHLRSFFGVYRAVNIAADRVKAYQVYRLRESAAPATINREVATLGRMLSLVEAGKLSRKPKFKRLEGEKVRQGFLEHRDFLRLVDNLPDHLRDVIEFLYLSGWRKAKPSRWNGATLT